ncbi:MAG TPA: AAA family ATPase, partial [Acidimicrobiales bacterium]|nr:AAA family ATPase [Acidimicrobiales bacterium]
MAQRGALPRRREAVNTGVPHERRRSSVPEAPRLYERETFLGEMSAMLSGGWPHLHGSIVIKGQAWTGKTALVGATCRMARELGFTVLRAFGNEFGRMAAWGVARQLLSAALPASPGTDDDGLRQEVFASNGHGPSAPGASEHEVHILLDGIVEDLASSSPVLIAVDDAHLMDKESAAWLLHVNRLLAYSGSKLVISSGPLQRGTPLTAIDRISYEPGARVITLQPLGEASVSHLLRDILGLEPPADLVCTVHGSSAGLPFVVISLARALASADGAWQDGPAGTVGDLATGDIGRAVLARLTSLPADASAL